MDAPGPARINTAEKQSHDKLMNLLEWIAAKLPATHIPADIIKAAEKQDDDVEKAMCLLRWVTANLPTKEEKAAFKIEVSNKYVPRMSILTCCHGRSSNGSLRVNKLQIGQTFVLL